MPFISTRRHDCNIHLSIEAELHHLLIQLDIIRLFIHLIWGHYSWKTCFNPGNIKPASQWLDSTLPLMLLYSESIGLMNSCRMKHSLDVSVFNFKDCLLLQVLSEGIKSPSAILDKSKCKAIKLRATQHVFDPEKAIIWSSSPAVYNNSVVFTHTKRCRLIHLQLHLILWYPQHGFCCLSLLYESLRCVFDSEDELRYCNPISFKILIGSVRDWRWVWQACSDIKLITDNTSKFILHSVVS